MFAWHTWTLRGCCHPCRRAPRGPNRCLCIEEENELVSLFPLTGHAKPSPLPLTRQRQYSTCWSMVGGKDALNLNSDLEDCRRTGRCSKTPNKIATDARFALTTETWRLNATPANRAAKGEQGLTSPLVKVKPPSLSSFRIV